MSKNGKQSAMLNKKAEIKNFCYQAITKTKLNEKRYQFNKYIVDLLKQLLFNTKLFQEANYYFNHIHYLFWGWTHVFNFCLQEKYGFRGHLQITLTYQVSQLVTQMLTQ